MWPTCINIRSLKFRFFLALASTLILSSCSESGGPDSPAHYNSGTATSGGSGRYYMEREIGSVMSHLNAGQLDRPERVTKERTDLLIELLPLEESMAIADIGAGSGYFSLRLARLLPNAQVLAVDIQPEMLSIIEQRAVEENLNNIELVRAEEKTSGLRPASADLILLVDSYHEFYWPREYMLDLRNALKPGGTIVMVEQRAEDENNRLVAAHKMSAGQLIAEMRAIQLYPTRSSDLLPEQHFMLFGQNEN